MTQTGSRARLRRGRRRLFALTLAAGVSMASHEPAAAQTPTPTQATPEAGQRPSAGTPAGGQAPAAPPVETLPQSQPIVPAADGAPEQEPANDDAKLTSTPGSKALGISILGNQEAPTSLVIVPWKSSELGKSLGSSPMLDDSTQPVDKDVFMRALRYYEIRSEPARHEGMTTGGRDHAAAESGSPQPSATRRR